MSRRQLLCTGLFIRLLYPLIWSGCSLENTPQEYRINDLGYFEFQPPDDQMKGIIIGAPRGGAEPGSGEYARLLSKRTGAGFLIASGFASKQLPVTQPRVGSIPSSVASSERGSIYREFKTLLRHTVNGDVKLYIGVRSAAQPIGADRIEVATSGFTFEQLAILKESFVRIRDEALSASSLPKIAIAVEPLDKIAWRVSGVKDHGVLIFAERGLNLRLPEILSTAAAEPTYARILSAWIAEICALLKDSTSQPETVVRLMDYGRLESVPSRKRQNGVVIGAPHGTFDQYTAEVVDEVSYRTGLAAVIARGFSPTECAGWRINVNRPTERRYPSGDLEIETERAAKVYRAFKEAVMEASKSELNLYIDIHQNGQQKNIEVASTGISKQEAQFIKKTYREVRDGVLRSRADVSSVDLLIEPVDEIEIGAWAAKAQGILGVAKKSLHFEFPLYPTLGSAGAREAYTDILTIVLRQTAPILLDTKPPPQRSVVNGDPRRAPTSKVSE
jgi:hypothetical protein